MLKRHLLLFIGLLSIFFLFSHPASAQSCNISWFTITPATGITPDTNLYIEVGGGCSNGVRAIRLSYNGQVFSELGSAAMSAYYTYQSDGELCAEIAAYGDDNWSNPGRRCQWISGSGQQQPQQPSQPSQPSQPQQPTGDVNAPGVDDWQRARMCQQMYGDQSYPSRRNNQWFCVGGSAAPQQPSQPSQPSQPQQPGVQPAQPQRGSGAACYAPEPVGVGSRARVRFGGVANRVRTGPSLGFDQIAQLNPGTEFNVIGDSVCADGYRWWQISLDGVVGWTADGNDREYWIEQISYSSPQAPQQETSNCDAVRNGHINRSNLRNCFAAMYASISSEEREGAVDFALGLLECGVSAGNVLLEVVFAGFSSRWNPNIMMASISNNPNLPDDAASCVTNFLP